MWAVSNDEDRSEVIVGWSVELECVAPGIVASDNCDSFWVHRSDSVTETASSRPRRSEDYNRHLVEGHLWMSLLPNENPMPTVVCSGTVHCRYCLAAVVVKYRRDHFHL